jgi:hypothetical protein
MGDYYGHSLLIDQREAAERRAEAAESDRDSLRAKLAEVTKERDWAVAVQRAALESQERLGTTLAAALQAKDEMADLAFRWIDETSLRPSEQAAANRITELRSVGKESK